MKHYIYNTLVGSALLATATIITPAAQAALAGDVVITGGSSTTLSGGDYTITPSTLGIGVATSDFSPLLSGATVSVTPLILAPAGGDFTLANNVIFTFEKGGGTVLTYTVPSGAHFTRTVVGDNTTGITTVFQSDAVVPGVLSIGGQTADTFLLATKFVTQFSESGTFYASIHANTAVPEPPTLIAGALLLLPFGLSSFRILRKNQVI